MLARRMLMFVVILLVLASVTAALAPPPPRVIPDKAKTSEPTTAGETPSASAVVERTIDADRRKPATIVVEQNDILNLTVTSGVTDAVELQGLSAVRAVAPETPVIFDVLTDVVGEYPVVLLDQERTVGTVRVVTQKER